MECKVTGLIEDMSDRFSKKIDEALPSSRMMTDSDVPELRRRLKRLEESVHHGPETSPLTLSASSMTSMASPQAMSDHRASDRLERKLSELSPKLDDLYIRVLPVMSERLS